MANINEISCATDIKNTGFCGCTFDPKQIIGLIFIPKGKTLTETEVSAALIGNTTKIAILAAKASRFYPVMGFVGITDNSEDVTSQTFGYGKSETVREGVYKFTLQFRKGALNLSNALRSFNGKQSNFDVLFVDANNTLIGTLKKDASGNKLLAGVPMDNIYTKPFKLNDGSNTTTYGIELSFEPSYVNESIAFKQYDVAEIVLKDLKGLQNINLKVTASTANTVSVKATTDCGDDLSEVYGIELTAITLWKVKKGSVSLPVTASPLTNGAFVLSFTNTGTSAGDILTVELETPLALNSGGIMLYEGIPTTFVRV